jgi:cell division cycle protein 37
MIEADKRAIGGFLTDVEQTYNHLVERVKVAKAEESASGGGSGSGASGAGQEQIQLVAAEDGEGTTISFNVPDGPPPEDLRLEGPGTEDLDIEEVRKALQFRWDVFSSLPEEMQEALKDGTLEAVNKVLGNMPVEEAEQVVNALNVGGILSFAEGGIRDETGKGKEAEEAVVVQS